jgi:hypothetical protein
VISIACSYFLGLFWRIFVTVVINWEDNQTVDVFNMYDTFYAYEDYGFVDEDGVHQSDSA